MALSPVAWSLQKTTCSCSAPSSKTSTPSGPATGELTGEPMAERSADMLVPLSVAPRGWVAYGRVTKGGVTHLATIVRRPPAPGIVRRSAQLLGGQQGTPE